MPDDRMDHKEPIPSELVTEDEGFADIAERFLDTMPGRIKRLEEALADRNFEALRSSAHQLKGSGGGYGYPLLTEAAGRLEQQAIDTQLEACQAGVEEIKALLPRLAIRAD